jgi:hypothetical protein
VGDLVPDLGCTRNKGTKFFRTIELYLHVKNMVAQGRDLIEQDIQILR